jgi:hypothetical protein
MTTNPFASLFPRTPDEIRARLAAMDREIQALDTTGPTSTRTQVG